MKSWAPACQAQLCSCSANRLCVGCHHAPASESSLETVVTVLLCRGPIVPGLLRCPSKMKDFREVCGRGWRAHTSHRAELPVCLCEIRCASWAVLGSGNGPYKLYMEIIYILLPRQEVLRWWR